MDWHPWGEEAFQKAKDAGRPVFLSIGYSSCHWCHVMAHESFSDPAVAALLNDNFVCIKVDREERPDLDRRYMLFVQMVTGSGGWPLSVFMTPDKEPFFGGTYFPPEDRFKLPAFSKVLKAVLEMFRRPGVDLGKSYREINKRLDRISTPGVAVDLGAELLKGGLESLKEGFDNVNGGHIGSPKFPQLTFLQYLLRMSKRLRDPEAYQHAELTARKMCRGGIYDQVGGGLHRYSVDAFWRVPHFEKMLYDQAKLVLFLCDLYQASQEAWALDYLKRTADFMISDLSTPVGFASSLDADTPEGEGRYYTWKEEELRALFGEPDFKFLSFYFDTTVEGSFEDGLNVISMPFDDELVAQRFQFPLERLKEKRSEIFSLLYKRRLGRKSPSKDDKAITSWNALACSALFRAGLIVGDEKYTASARTVLSAIERTARAGRMTRLLDGGGPGFLEDQAYSASALIDGFLATGEAGLLATAKTLAEEALAGYYDPVNAVFFYTPLNPKMQGEGIRDYPYDQEMPSASAEMARVLLRLYALEPAPKYLHLASKVLSSYHRSLRSPSMDTANLLCALDMYIGPVRVAVLVNGSGMTEMKERLLSYFDPGLLLLQLDTGAGAATPLLEGKTALGGKATVYLCDTGGCRPPITDPAALEGLLG